MGKDSKGRDYFIQAAFSLKNLPLNFNATFTRLIRMGTSRSGPITAPAVNDLAHLIIIPLSDNEPG